MNKVQQLREVVKKLVPMIGARGIAVTQVGAQAFVQTDPKTKKPFRVNIPNLPDDADDALVFAIQGFIDHEIGHVLDTDWVAVGEALAIGAKLGPSRGMTPKAGAQRLDCLHNIVEDPYVEAAMTKRFKGSAYNIDKLHDIFITRICKPGIDNAKTPEDRFGCILVPLVRAWAGQQKFADLIAANGYDKDPLVAALNKAVPDTVKERFRNIKDSWESLELAKILFDIIHPEPPPPPPAPPSMADAINEEMKEQEQPNDEQSDSEKSDDPDGEGNNQDKPEDEEDKGSDGEQPDEQQSSADQEGEDGEGDTGEGEKDGEEGKETEAGSEGEEEADDAEADAAGDDDETGETEGDEESSGGRDGDPDEDEGDDADSEGGADAGDEDDDGAEADGDDEGAGGSAEPLDEDDGDEAGDDDAAGDDEGGSGDGAESDEEADGSGGGEGDGEDAENASDSDGSDDQDAEDADDSSGAGDSDGDDEEGESSGDAGDEADGEVGSEGDDQDDGESRSAGEKADAEDEAKTGRHQLEEAPESSPFQGLEVENLGDDMSKGIAFIITNEATRNIKGLDYRVYTTEWDVCEKFPVPDGNPTLEVYRPSKTGKTRSGRARWETAKVTLNEMVQELDERTGHMVAPMQKDIERMMAARSQVLKVPGFRSGRLHSGSLHRLRTGDDRVFRRLEEHKSQETAVTLLIDNSGSMSGEKMQMAMSAGYALSSTLQRVNIKHEVIGFTTMVPRSPEDWAEQQQAEEERIGKPFSRYGALYHPIYKEVNERLTPEVKRRFAIAPYTCKMSGNTDGESVRFAGNRLALRQEPRKVLIVLSDGHPAGMSYFGEEIYSDLHRAVEECEKKRIETIGIGIMDDAVKTFYPKSVVLKDLNELPKQVMKELKGILLQ